MNEVPVSLSRSRFLGTRKKKYVSTICKAVQCLSTQSSVLLVNRVLNQLQHSYCSTVLPFWSYQKVSKVSSQQLWEAQELLVRTQYSLRNKIYAIPQLN